MTDLLVTSVTPSLDTGRNVRTYGVTAALAQLGAVEVAYVVFDGSVPARPFAELPAVTLHPLLASRGIRRALEYMGARLRGVPGDFARGVSPELARTAKQAPRGVRVIADGPVVAGALLRLVNVREVVYLAHNLESGFRVAARGGDLRQFERHLLRSFAECWMPTHADVAAAVALGGERVRARYVPNVVDVERIAPAAPAGRERLLFVADFTYEPNREALRFLADEILPLVWQRRPGVSVLAVGRGLSDPPPDARIEAPGFVEDLAAAYAAADVVVVPLLHGGGSPLKFIEGMAYGLPVLATRHAAGLLEDATAGVDFIAAADAVEFAGALDAILSDPARAAAVGAAGRELVERSYSVAALAKLLRS
jgi:glycosyltransferase involved in cell wall biosynthesis